MKSQELQYYFWFCIQRPYIWWKLIYYILYRLYLRLRDKMLGQTDRLPHYPNEIRKKVNQNSWGYAASSDWFNQLPPTGWVAGNGLCLEEWPIPLATHPIHFKELNWYSTEQDQENTFALNRFVWLLRWVSLRPSKTDLPTADKMITDWIEQVGAVEKTPAWETYSVSERVVNWLLYLCATKDQRITTPEFIQTVQASLVQHLNYIVYHLEYHNGRGNNHLLNNARALYIGGQLLQIPQFTELGQILIQHHTPAMISSQGELLEGSTHYQLLLTRTYLEIFWTAKMTGDGEFAEYLEKIALAMTRCCLYLSGNNSPDNFPRIGDISPDCPVSWFYPIQPYHQNTESWWRLWDNSITSLLKLESINYHNDFNSIREWKWIKSSTFKVLVYNLSNPKEYPACHGHLDFGGFLLYDEEEPILVDRGRSSYSYDTLSIYACSPKAHNTTLINGLPLLPNNYGPFTAYTEYLSNVQLEILDHAILWQSTGIERFGKGLRWHRNLTLSPNLEVLEAITNPNGIYLAIESNIHWSPGWLLIQSLDSGFVVKKGNKKYHFTIDCSVTNSKIEWFNGSNGTIPQDLGHHFPEYGCQVLALTMQISFQTTENYTLKFNLCPI